jgi:hypothetical protein
MRCMPERDEWATIFSVATSRCTMLSVITKDYFHCSELICLPNPRDADRVILYVRPNRS